MRIHSYDIIAGQSALLIRKLMKQEKGTIGTIEEILTVDAEVAKQIYQSLLEEGYIEQQKRLPIDQKDTIRWQTTIKGNALANATARKPITRKTAERLITDFLQRVKEINACDEYVYRIEKVIVFGSYLSDSPTLGDIDLYIVLAQRYSDKKEHEARRDARIHQALQQGKNFKNFVEQIGWPQLEIYHILKNRSPSISLHAAETEQILSTGIPSKVLFDATIDE